jgi:hypothetical protein
MELHVSVVFSLKRRDEEGPADTVPLPEPTICWNPKVGHNKSGVTLYSRINEWIDDNFREEAMGREREPVHSDRPGRRVDVEELAIRLIYRRSMIRYVPVGDKGKSILGL